MEMGGAPLPGQGIAIENFLAGSRSCGEQPSSQAEARLPPPVKGRISAKSCIFMPSGSGIQGNLDRYLARLIRQLVFRFEEFFADRRVEGFHATVEEAGDKFAIGQVVD